MKKIYVLLVFLAAFVISCSDVKNDVVIIDVTQTQQPTSENLSPTITVEVVEPTIISPTPSPDRVEFFAFADRLEGNLNVYDEKLDLVRAQYELVRADPNLWENADWIQRTIDYLLELDTAEDELVKDNIIPFRLGDGEPYYVLSRFIHIPDQMFNLIYMRPFGPVSKSEFFLGKVELFDQIINSTVVDEQYTTLRNLVTMLRTEETIKLKPSDGAIHSPSDHFAPQTVNFFSNTLELLLIDLDKVEYLRNTLFQNRNDLEKINDNFFWNEIFAVIDDEQGDLLFGRYGYEGMGDVTTMFDYETVGAIGPKVEETQPYATYVQNLIRAIRTTNSNTQPEVVQLYIDRAIAGLDRYHDYLAGLIAFIQPYVEQSSLIVTPTPIARDLTLISDPNVVLVNFPDNLITLGPVIKTHYEGDLAIAPDGYDYVFDGENALIIYIEEQILDDWIEYEWYVSPAGSDLVTPSGDFIDSESIYSGGQLFPEHINQRYGEYMHIGEYEAGDYILDILVNGELIYRCHLLFE